MKYASYIERYKFGTDNIQQWHPLANKFIHSDVVGPRRLVSGSQWSISAMFSLKTHLQNRTWKGVPKGRKKMPKKKKKRQKQFEKRVLHVASIVKKEK